jgi:hypothetical protein
MKFIQYLNEERSQHITRSAAIDLIKKNCSIIYKKYKDGMPKLWRGVRHSQSNYLFVDGASSQNLRRSAHAYYNYYTLLFDNLPSWKDYPKRSKSIICSNSQFTANTYGEIYLVFPYNNVKIGEASSDDIWVSFKDLGNLDCIFNISLHRILSANKGGARFDKNWSQLESALKSLKDKLKQIKIKDLYPSPSRELFYKAKSGDILEYLDEILNPQKNGFRLITTNDNFRNEIHGAEREYWLEGPAILISVDHTREILDDK